jgi:hypothetical protein|tara:strand:- start:3535 stop:3786 length:252 start_codon:yes stop_codon:yes gene_type:complete
MEYHILTPIEILKDWLLYKCIPNSYKVDVVVEPYIKPDDVSVITQSYIIYTIYYNKKKIRTFIIYPGYDTSLHNQLVHMSNYN